MIKYLSITLVLYYSASSAQVTDKQFYTKEGATTDSIHSIYYMLKSSSGEEYDPASYYTGSNILRSEEKTDHDTGKGIRTYYHTNGNVQSTCSFVKGRLDGDEVVFYENGIKQSEILYGEKALTGINYQIKNYWDSLGNQIVKDGEGICECSFNSFFTSKRMIEKGLVKNGRRDGVWLTFEDGVKVYEDRYDLGAFVSGVLFDESGKTYPYKEIEKMAEPVGGLGKFYQNIGLNMSYPKTARRNGVQGKVFVEFVVNSDGSLSDFRIVKGIGSGCDEEAIKALRQTNIKIKWNPGYQHGKPVRTRFVLPLMFKL